MGNCSRYCLVGPTDLGYFAKIIKSKLEAEPFVTYSFLFRDDSFISSLEKHFRDASITEVVTSLLSDNLTKIKESMATPDQCLQFTQGEVLEAKQLHEESAVRKSLRTILPYCRVC